MDEDYIVRWQSDLVNTKKTVCDKPDYTNEGISQKWEDIKNLRNYALLSLLNDCNNLEMVTFIILVDDCYNVVRGCILDKYNKLRINRHCEYK